MPHEEYDSMIVWVQESYSRTSAETLEKYPRAIRTNRSFAMRPRQRHRLTLTEADILNGSVSQFCIGSRAM